MLAATVFIFVLSARPVDARSAATAHRADRAADSGCGCPDRADDALLKQAKERADAIYTDGYYEPESNAENQVRKLASQVKRRFPEREGHDRAERVRLMNAEKREVDEVLAELYEKTTQRLESAESEDMARASCPEAKQALSKLYAAERRSLDEAYERDLSFIAKEVVGAVNLTCGCHLSADTAVGRRPAAPCAMCRSGSQPTPRSTAVSSSHRRRGAGRGRLQTDEPPPAGCVRVTVRVDPAPLPSDPSNESIGEGVGSATLEPGGEAIHCLNPADAPCVRTVDVPADTPATVSAQPGSLSEDPSSPPDSAFWKFAGACTGTGTCTFMPTAGATVDVYFIPAMVTLTLKASGDEGHANMTANEDKGGGLEPAGPVYCGFTYPANPLPCKVMVRVQKFAQVEANTAGDPNIALAGFSNNCTPEAPEASFCEIRMTSDQTVTAMFGTVGIG